MPLKMIISACLLLLPLVSGMTLETVIPSGVLEPMEFQHRVILDQNENFIMFWSPFPNDILIEIQVATTGFIGLGFSPNGGMKGADIVLAWVHDHTRELHVHDRFAREMMIPEIDDVQDIQVFGGYQNDTHTVLRFSRPWNTCDNTHDLKLNSDTVRVIWSYAFEDPTGNMEMGKHDFRGTKSIYLQESRFTLPELPDDVKSVDLLGSEVALPDDLDTMYWCQVFKIPEILEKKHHMIGYVPVIQDGNLELVHHMLLLECHINESSVHYEQWLKEGGRQCLVPNMPPSWMYCAHPIIAWAIGSEGDIYPEHVGLPLGEDFGGANYHMIEIHYNNPTFKKGVVDSSGLRIFYTENLREIDAGVMEVGTTVTPLLVIPPKQNWMVTGICSDDCTRENFPEDGIKIFQGLLHAHLMGRSITIRQIRNGRELPVHFKDMNYDFNYQQQRILKEDMTVLPGDTLIVECVYDSTKRSSPTFGGEGTEDEMCEAYLTYYPRVNVTKCLSQPELPNIYEPLGVKEIYEKEKKAKSFKNIYGFSDTNNIKALDKQILENPSGQFTDLDFSLQLKDVLLKSPKEYRNQTLYDFFHDTKTWKNPKLVAALQEQMTYGLHTPFCMKIKEAPVVKRMKDTIRYPDFITFKTMEDDICTSHEPEVYISSKRERGEEYIKVDDEELKSQEPSMKQDGKSESHATAGSSSLLLVSSLIVFLSFSNRGLPMEA